MSDGKELATIGQELGAKRKQFSAALVGTGIAPEKFIRTVLTATNQEPTLLNANRASLMNAALKCATDGLLPDGRDAALVAFDDQVSYMPMIAGIRKKVRRSGEVTTWDVVAVYSKDQFHYQLGDDPHIHHVPWNPPPLEQGAEESDQEFHKRRVRHAHPGHITHAYSVARLKRGEISRDVMTTLEVEIVRDQYARKNRKGEYSLAWRKAFGEMAKKTVARRHSKVLPMSSDLEALLRRDDDQYVLDREPKERIEAPKDLSDRLDFLTSYEPEPTITREESPDLGPQGQAPGEDLQPPVDRSPPAAEIAPPASSPKPEAAAGSSSPAATLKRLTERGDSIAQTHGYAAVELWINNELSADETALISVTMDRRWRQMGQKK